MTFKILATVVTGSFLLLGCAETGQYPLTGMDVGPNDQVKFMNAPMDIAHY